MKKLEAVKVIASAGYCRAVDDAEGLPDLRALVKESTGAHVRRVTRFVQLALIGAGRCASSRKLPSDTGVYLSSCRGDTEVTASLLEELLRREELPSPLTFVNSVSNAACFHVASVLGLEERSNFITNRFDPVAAALKTASVDIARGENRLALAGSVDSCAMPLDDHRRRIHVEPQLRVGEASHWLLVSSLADDLPGIGSLRVANLASREELLDWLAGMSFEMPPLLALGQHLPAGDGRTLADALNARLWDYRASLPYFDSPTGAALDSFFRERKEASLLHVNSDPAGRFSVILAQRS